MPHDKSTKKGIRTEFFVANAEALEALDKNINNYILIKTDEYNEKQGIEDKDESTRLQIKLAELTKDKNYSDEITLSNVHRETYRLHVELAKLSVRDTEIRFEDSKVRLEETKLKLELERLKYGGDKYVRDNPDKNILRKTPKNHKCINNICTKLTHKQGVMCKYCSCKKLVSNSIKNGRPSYSKLQDDLTHMNYDEIGTKYNTTRQNVKNWLRLYKKYNLLD